MKLTKQHLTMYVKHITRSTLETPVSFKKLKYCFLNHSTLSFSSARYKNVFVSSKQHA